MGYTTLVGSLESVAAKDSFSYEEISIENLDNQIHKLRNKESTSLKVLWWNNLVEGATLEVEEYIITNYLYFSFQNQFQLEVIVFINSLSIMSLIYFLVITCIYKFNLVYVLGKDSIIILYSSFKTQCWDHNSFLTLST